MEKVENKHILLYNHSKSLDSSYDWISLQLFFHWRIMNQIKKTRKALLATCEMKTTVYQGKKPRKLRKRKQMDDRLDEIPESIQELEDEDIIVPQKFESPNKLVCLDTSCNTSGEDLCLQWEKFRFELTDELPESDSAEYRFAEPETDESTRFFDENDSSHPN
jgi:hypothetical protein